MPIVYLFGIGLRTMTDKLVFWDNLLTQQIESLR